MRARPVGLVDEQFDLLLRELGVTPVREEPWLYLGSSGRRHGWKLHISTIPTQASRLVRAVVPLLVAGGHAFKIAADRDVLRRLNEGALGDTQVGKFCTVYPVADDEVETLATTLNEVLGDSFVGPTVVTDARLGPVLYARYGAFQARMQRNRIGISYATITLPDGEIVADEYRVPFTPPTGITPPFRVRNAAGVLRAEPHVSPRRLFGPHLLLVDVLKSGAKGRTFLAVDLSARKRTRRVVVKEGRKYCLSDDLGRDMRDRLRHQQEVMTRVASLEVAPPPGRYFEIGGDGFLTADFVTGQDYEGLVSASFRDRDDRGRREVLDSLTDLATVLARLHGVGVVHRDVTPSNARWSRDGGARLLDFELSYVQGSGVPHFRLGTPGFMSPQQMAGDLPDPSDDVYAFGCLAFLLLTSFDPRYVLDLPDRRRGSLSQELSGAPPSLVSLVAQMIAPDRARRPHMTHVRNALADMHRGRSATLPAWPDHGRRSSTLGRHVLDPMAAGLVEAVERDAQGLWLSLDTHSHEDGPRNNQRLELYRSAYRGVAGPVYLLSRITKAGADRADVADLVTRAVDWLLAHEHTPDDQMPGLHFGEAGVAVAVAEAVSAGIVPNGDWLNDYVREALQGPLDWPDLTHGAAGQGMAALVVARVLGEPGYAFLASPAAQYLAANQNSDGGWTLPGTVQGMSGETYTGFAHGAAGVVTFLSRYAATCGDATSRSAAELGAAWLESQARRTDAGTALVWPVKVGSPEHWRWWCHGNAGIALAFLTLFRDTGVERYAELARMALRGLPRRERGADLGHCHGLSGIAEVYMDAAEVLGQAEWMGRSRHLAETLLRLAAPGPGTLTWRVRAGSPPTADLMVGAGGPAHALLRNVCPGMFGPPLL